MKFSVFTIIGILALSASAVDAAALGKRDSPHTITVVNSCNFTIWPGIFTSVGEGPTPSATGWEQASGKSYTLTVPAKWNGRLWGRTNCNFSKPDLQNCDTGYCIGGFQCKNSGVPPLTLAEFQMDSPDDWYDVSNVDGSNLPMQIIPSVSSCTSPACAKDMNTICPSQLQFRNANGDVVGCKSACLAFGAPEYCCTGSHNTRETCPPTSYSQIFKNACPTAYSYAYDDPTSLFVCHAANYQVVFCPTQSSAQSAETTMKPKSTQSSTVR